MSGKAARLRRSRAQAPEGPRRTPAPAARSRRPWLPGGAWTLAALALAAGLRLWNLGHGLPEFLEEAIPFRRALAMWDLPGGGIDWNPHFFQYPSLTLYLHLLLQQAGCLVGRALGVYHGPADYQLAFAIDPTPMALPARLAQVVADLVTVALAARIAERLRTGSAAAVGLLVACSTTLIVASRAIYTDTVMTALALAALDRMLAYRVAGGGRKLAAAAALVGLATGAKYPAAVLLLPLAWVLWRREGTRGLALLPAAAAGSLVAFLLTTPGALFDGTTFLKDLGVMRGLATEGHLGSLGPAGFRFYLAGLVAEVGWHGVALAAAALVVCAWSRTRRDAAVAIGLALLGFAVPISIGRAEAGRYLIPVLPLVAVLLVAGLIEIAGRVPGRLRRPAFAALLAVFALPALIAGVRAGARSEDDSRIAARRWCEAHLRRGDIVLQETYGAPLLGRGRWQDLRETIDYRDASPEWRRRLDGMRWYQEIELPLAVVGSARATVRRPDGSQLVLEVFPHVVDLNQMAYEPRLLAGVDYVVTSGAVRHRFEADRRRFETQQRFYALLDSTAEVAMRIAPRDPGSGPDITIYRLGAAARAALARLGPLDPLWWADCVPRSYREQANPLFVRPGESPTLEVRGADGRPAPWVRSLRRLYEARLQPLVDGLAVELQQGSRFAPAREKAAATMEMAPEDVQACLLYADCSGRLGEWAAARAALERTLAARAASGDVPPVLRYEHAETLARTGDLAGARAELERVAASSDPVLAGQARLALQSAGGTFRAVR